MSNNFYDKVEGSLAKSRDNLLKGGNLDSKYFINDTEKDMLKDAINIFDDFEQKAKHNLEQMRQNAEWKDLHIAFYGETNAGKSTLIETLRIYFNENTKQTQSNKYKQAQAEFNKCKDEIDSITKQIKLLEQERSEHKNKRIEYENNIKKINNNIKSLESKLKENNAKLDSKAQEQNALNYSKNEYNKNLANIESISKDIQNLQDLESKYKNELSQYENNMNENNATLQKLESTLKIDNEKLDSNKLNKANFFTRFFKRLFNASEYKEYKRLQDSIKNVNSKIETLNKESQNLNDNIKKQNELIQKNAQDIESKKETRKKLSQENDYLSKEIAKLDSVTLDISNLNKEIETINDDIKSQIKDKKANEVNITNCTASIIKITQDIESKIMQKNAIIESNYKYLESMKDNRDGMIIGDGRNDFTKSMVEYRFSGNNLQNDFILLDVPGIEGSEQKVLDEINKALAKAHIIFYIKKDPNPPQKGDNGKKGTIEKIKEQLNAQAEIYAVYNKPITSPHAISDNLLNDGEKNELNTLDSKMNEYLGENHNHKYYRGHKVLSAQIAFYAIADNLLSKDEIATLKQKDKDMVVTITLESKQKFLDKFSKYELLEFSQVNAFGQFLENLTRDSKEKIRDSHIQKATSIVKDFKSIIDKIIKEKYTPLLKDIENELENTKNNLDFIKDDFIDKCKNKTKNLIEASISTIKRSVQNEIDKNINDKTFQSRFESIADDELKTTLKNKLESSMKESQKELDKHIKEELEKYKDRLDMHIQDNLRHSLKDDFGNTLDISKIDNGIKYGQLAMSIGGTALGVWSGIAILGAANAWNPGGWIIIVASVIGGLVAVGKSIYKFFSDSYKKSEQEKAMRKALEKIESDIKDDVFSKLDSLREELGEKIQELEDILEKNLEPLRVTNAALKNISKELKYLESNIPNLI